MSEGKKAVGLEIEKWVEEAGEEEIANRAMDVRAEQMERVLLQV